MSIPRPTPPPRNRKARRKLSRGQVAFLDRKAVRDKAKAERDKEQRLDAWHLTTFHPEIAKARRAKGVENHAEASAWRRRAFVESFTDWPEVLTPDALAYEIRNWLRVQRRMRWRGCPKRYPNKEASVRKKLTELEVFRYNIRAGVWFKVGSVEGAEATQRLAERNEEERLKRTRARDGWHDFIPDDLKPTMLGVLIECGHLPDGRQLSELSEFGLSWVVEQVSISAGWDNLNARLRKRRERLMREVAEAVLVAD